MTSSINNKMLAPNNPGKMATEQTILNQSSKWLKSASRIINLATTINTSNIRIVMPDQIVKNLVKIAVPLAISASASAISQVQAITIVECFENCDKHRDAHELAKLICYTLCAIFSKG